MNSMLVFLTFLLLYFLLIWKAGKTYPILYLFLFVYFVQYVFSVYLIYNEYPVLRKQMPIGQEELFGYIIPALVFLFAGIFIFNKDLQVSHLMKKIDRRQATNLGHLLVAASYFFDILPLLGIVAAKSILSFTYYLKFIGAMCYLCAPSTLNYFLIGIIYLDLARNALQVGIFIDFFIWTTHLFFQATLNYNLSLKMRSLFIVMAVPLLVIIQSVKDDYRESTWSGKRQPGLDLITELASREQAKEEGPLTNSDGIVKTVGRLNQGWHLGKVLKWVPKNQPFADGEDLLGDVEGAMLPRILFPEKKMGGTQDKFHTYTGYKLTEGTSMTIGVLGDFYVNFGRWGSFVALFIFGAIISRLLYTFTYKYILPDPINIVWIPFLFSYMIRANNDFYFVFNSLVKGFLIFLFINYLRKQLWPTIPR
jgi:hypothetical protein